MHREDCEYRRYPDLFQHNAWNGHYIEVPNLYRRCETCDGETITVRINFCPLCGAKLRDAEVSA